MVVHGAVNKSVLATKKQTGRAAKLSRGVIKGIEKACWSAGTIAAHQGGRAVAKVQSTGAYQSRFGGSGDDDEEDSARVAAFKRRVDQVSRLPSLRGVCVWVVTFSSLSSSFSFTSRVSGVRGLLRCLPSSFPSFLSRV